MPRPERIIVGIAGSLFVLAAVLEGLSRLADQPALHEAATWAVMAAVLVVIVPIAVAVVAYQALVARNKNGDST